MINFAYIGFIYILIGQVVLFLIITLPTPSAIKSKIVRLFMGSSLRSNLMWVHFALCILSAIFFIQLVQSQTSINSQIDMLHAKSNGQVGTEVRIGFLSYQIQRIHRNKQIVAMVIYASLALNLYIRMLYMIYKQRGDYDGLPDPDVQRKLKDAKKQAQQQQKRQVEQAQKLKKLNSIKAANAQVKTQ